MNVSTFFQPACEYDCTSRLPVCGNNMFIVHLSKPTDYYAVKLLSDRESDIIHVVESAMLVDLLEMYAMLFVEVIGRVTRGRCELHRRCRVHIVHADLKLNLISDIYH